MGSILMSAPRHPLVEMDEPLAHTDAPIPLFKVFMAQPAELDEELLRVVHSGRPTSATTALYQTYFCTPRPSNAC